MMDMPFRRQVKIKVKVETHFHSLSFTLFYQLSF